MRSIGIADRQVATGEPATVPTVATPSAAEFVADLLATKDERRRRTLITNHGLSAEDLRTVVLDLVERARRMMGADPPGMQRITLDAMALATASGDPFLEAMARMRYGDVCRAQARHAEACACYDEAAAAFTRLGHPLEAIRTRIGWILAVASLGQPKRAFAAARKARRELVARGETALLAQLELNTANLYGNQGHLRPALRHYGVALGLFGSLGDAYRPLVGSCHQNRGLALSRLGRRREALSELQLARDIFEERGEAVGVARLTRSIGEIEMGLGHYTAALRAFDAARERFVALGQTGAGPMIDVNAADCYLCLNRANDALRVLQSADAELERRQDAEYALGVSTRKIAAYLMLEQRQAAISVLDDIERRLPAGPVHYRAWLSVQRAGLLVRDGAAEEGLAESRRARALARLAGMPRLISEARLQEGAALLALGRADVARRSALLARRIARSLDAAPLLHRCHELLGLAAEAAGRPERARDHYTIAIEQLEREQRGVIFEFRDSFAADRGTAYERLAILLLQAGRTTEALATVERAKSRALADAIGGTIELRPRGSAATRRLMRELAKAREDYAEANRSAAGANGTGHQQAGDLRTGSLASIESRITELIQRLQIAGDEASDLYGSALPKLPALPPATALLEFFIAGDDVLRFLVDETGVRGEVLCGLKPEIDRLLRAFRLNLDAAERSEPARRHALLGQSRAVLGRLYERLIGDLPSLDRYCSLIVVPHGELHYLPFHALFDGQRYLVERLAVSYAPSAAVYGSCRSRRPSRDGALVLAHSSGGRLPYTLREAEMVAGVLKTRPYLENAAVRARLNGAAHNAAIIHIAAHGWFRPDAPLFSSVELADGPLTTADVFNLDLRAALVTLSACETGRAVLGGGDELVGLTRAFLYAGAAGMLVSQWRVDDSSTAALMERFYRELQGGAGRAEALRRAQLAEIRSDSDGGDRSHPFFWAGFQIIGDNQALRRRPQAALSGGA